MKKYVILSPHLDDAVLSCGDYISYLIEQKCKVEVISVFAGDYNENCLSDMAKEFHSMCELTNNIVEARRKEDKKAMELLGCSFIHMEFMDCIYRSNILGEFVYTDFCQIYESNVHEEEEIVQNIKAEIYKLISDADVVLSPLAIGNHIDHMIVSYVARKLEKTCPEKMVFYEDFPYVLNYKLSEWKELVKDMNCKTIEFRETFFINKLKAAKCYLSQNRMLWGNETERIEQMKSFSKRYVDSKGYGIRLWYL